MKKVLLIMLYAFSSLVYAQEPSYEVHRISTPIVIDGIVGAEEWDSASKAVEFIFPWDSQTGAKQKTHARLLWDDNNLYVAYECEDTDICAQYLERDDNVYLDDTIEIFLNVMPSQTDVYYGLEINVRCVYFDYLCTSARFFHKLYQFEGLKVCSHIDGTLNMRGDKDIGWSVEAAIPWKNFSSMARRGPKVGTEYTANLNRWDGIRPDRRLSVWSDSKLNWPHPHAPEHFGKLTFVE